MYLDMNELHSYTITVNDLQIKAIVYIYIIRGNILEGTNISEFLED